MHANTTLLSLVTIALVAATLATPSAGQATTDSKRPNIVLIVSDDQGFGDLGCYGSSVIHTPHLDRLARDGVRLTNFYVTSPACTPSRGSLLTGRYPQRNGTVELFRNKAVDLGYLYDETEYATSPERVLGMDERELLLPAILGKAGYTSGIFGKWDLGQLKRFLPLQRGFDDFYGFVNTGIDYYTHERYGIASMYRNNSPSVEDKGTYATDLFRREAVRFLRANRARPFFLYVPFNAPHSASSLDPRIRGSAQAPDAYKKLYPDLKTRYVTREIQGEMVEVPDAQTRRLEYLAATTCMDDAIGELLAILDESGLATNTLIIFLSDNGGASAADNGPLRGGKGNVFDGGVRVPCIVRWPGRVPTGSVCDEFLSALEITPTIAAAARVALPAGVTMDGFDMLDVLAGNATTARDEMFWEFRKEQAARVGHWKWVHSAKGSGLFDLSADVGEKNDLSTSRPEVLARVKARFAAWQEAMRQTEPRGPFRDY